MHPGNMLRVQGGIRDNKSVNEMMDCTRRYLSDGSCKDKGNHLMLSTRNGNVDDCCSLSYMAEKNCIIPFVNMISCIELSSAPSLIDNKAITSYLLYGDRERGIGAIPVEA